MINIVTIDPSLVSTGMTINGKMFSITTTNTALNSKGQHKKWFKHVEDHCDIIVNDPQYKSIKNYSDSEAAKHQYFYSTVSSIIKLIDINCNTAYNTVVLIEGYSYSSAAGPIIDLVTFGTLLRQELRIMPNTEVVILAPLSIKKRAAMLVYEPIAKGKKLEYRNKQGVSGGSFTKHDIYKSLVEYSNIKDTEWVKLLKELQDEIFDVKNVPKPIEDINDSVVMYHIAYKIVESCDSNFEKSVSKLKEA